MKQCSDKFSAQLMSVYLLCTDPCCDPTTCTPVNGAQCASGSCCNTTTCEFYPRGHTCRESINDCDITEYCSGVYHDCSIDYLAQMGTACTINGQQSICFEGSCVLSKQQQCELHFSELELQMHYVIP